MRRSAANRVARLAVPVVAVIAALAACNDERPTLSVESAKRIVAAFRSVAAAPPRRISDVVAILDRRRDIDEAALARLRDAAERPEPENAGHGARGEFFLRRAAAAGRLGRSRQEIADYAASVRAFGLAGDDEAGLRATFELGIVQIRAGNYSSGVATIRRSLAASRRVGRQGTIGEEFVRLGEMHARTGEFVAAEALLDRTRLILPTLDEATEFSDADRLTIEVLLLQGRALILDRMGRLIEAEASYRKAISAWRALKTLAEEGPAASPADDRVHGLLMTRLAANLLLQGRHVEAEFESRRALLLALRVHGKYSAATASTLRTFTRSVLEQGRLAEAETLARLALDIYRRSGVQPGALNHAIARSLLGDVLVARRNWAGAKAEYEAMEADLASDPAAYRRFLADNIEWATVYAQLGRTRRALKILRRALTNVPSEGEAAALRRAEIRGLIAMTVARSGDRAEGLRQFRQAMPVLEKAHLDRGFGSRSSSTHDRRFSLIATSYLETLAAIRGQAIESRAALDAAGEAFRVADMLRSRRVQRALASNAARAAARDPRLAELVRREQDARTRIDRIEALLAEFLSAPENERNSSIQRELVARIEQLRAARSPLLRAIEREFPEYRDLIAPRSPSIEQARRSLRPGEALLTTLTTEHRVYVWAIPRVGAAQFHTAPIARAKLATIVRHLRQALEPDILTIGGMPRFDIGAAHGLFARLLQPVASGWQDARTIVYVPHGPLGHLPLALLPTRKSKLVRDNETLFAEYRKVPWLARTHEVVVLPSVATLGSLRNSPEGPRARLGFAGFGDPYFSTRQARKARLRAAAKKKAGAVGQQSSRGPAVVVRQQPATRMLARAGIGDLPRLPETRDEIQSIGKALGAVPERDLFLGSDASEQMVKSADLRRYRVLAFATHGLVTGDLDGLDQPALALSAPEVVGGSEDGLLTMGEILGLELDADWVVLSACNTGAGDGAGAEAVSGLGRAFFYAGSRALLVTNWRVESRSAMALTTDIFRRQARTPGLARSTALRQAMVGLIDGPGYLNAQGKTVFSYAHPIFWAPFSLVGDGGGGGGDAAGLERRSPVR